MDSLLNDCKFSKYASFKNFVNPWKYHLLHRSHSFFFLDHKFSVSFIWPFCYCYKPNRENFFIDDVIIKSFQNVKLFIFVIFTRLLQDFHWQKFLQFSTVTNFIFLLANIFTKFSLENFLQGFYWPHFYKIFISF